MLFQTQYMKTIFRFSLIFHWIYISVAKTFFFFWNISILKCFSLEFPFQISKSAHTGNYLITQLYTQQQCHNKSDYHRNHMLINNMKYALCSHGCCIICIAYEFGFIFKIYVVCVDLKTNQLIVTQMKTRNSQLTWSSSFVQIVLADSHLPTPFRLFEIKEEDEKNTFLNWSTCYYGDNKIQIVCCILIRKCKPFMLSCKLCSTKSLVPTYIVLL